jgi:hypothetical protein
MNPSGSIQSQEPPGHGSRPLGTLGTPGILILNTRRSYLIGFCITWVSIFPVAQDRISFFLLKARAIWIARFKKEGRAKGGRRGDRNLAGHGDDGSGGRS